jgi:hypothetical protein
MQITLLTPVGLLVCLLTLVPLAALALSDDRARRVREAIGLGRPDRLQTAGLGLAIALTGLLVGAAAAQPVLERGTMRKERTDVNAYVLIDETRSMLAAGAPDGANRMARARVAAQELREVVPELKVGVASFTDRVLPHLFPTLDQQMFAATLTQSVGIERPPPARRRRNATDLNALQQLGAQGYFPATPERRIVVVLSDFETDPFSMTKLGAALRRQRLETIFVHVWDDGERIFGGLGDAEYRADAESRNTAARVAAASSGQAFSESELGEAKRALRSLLGSGASRTRWEERSTVELTPWLSLAALLPVGFILWRRNLR